MTRSALKTAVIALAMLLPLTAAAQSEQVVYFHTDAIGSVRATTDGNGQEIGTYDYLPFGQAAPGSPGSSETRRFTGQDRDAATALDYFGARYYSSGTGRFTTVDPEHVGGDILDPQSWNAYAYARNNPFSFVDPTGTNYFVNPSGGTAFSFDGSWDAFGHFASGFTFDGDRWGGVIRNAFGAKIGTYRYYDPNGFDAFAYRTGRLAAAEFKYGTIGMGISAGLGVTAGLAAGGLSGGLTADPILGLTSRALDANKLNHLFAKAAHKLGPLVTQLGSREAAGAAIERAVQAEVARRGLSGL